MHSPRRSVVLVLAIALLAPPAIARADKCGGTKLKSSGDAISKTLECDSKAESKGKAPDAPCDTKPGANVAKDFAKADRRLSCPGSASAVVSALGTCESNVLAAVGASESSPTESKCDSKKVAAAAKKASAELGCLSKQATRGTDPTACLAEAESKFAAAMAKLTSATDCSSTTDAATLETVVEGCVNDVLAALSPSTTSTTTTTTSTTTTTTATETTSTTEVTTTTESSSTTSSTTATTTSVPSTTTTTLQSCQLGNGIKHVVHITFDNVHFTRDNPNVLSDLEQIPALVDFIESNGTMLSNHHTPLIAHTGDDLFTQYTGIYGDRHGMGISNSYEYYNGTTVTSADSFVYWASPIIDHGPQRPSTTDLNPSMVYSEQVPPVAIPSASTGQDAMTPAPWAP